MEALIPVAAGVLAGGLILMNPPASKRSKQDKFVEDMFEGTQNQERGEATDLDDEMVREIQSGMYCLVDKVDFENAVITRSGQMMPFQTVKVTLKDGNYVHFLTSIPPKEVDKISVPGTSF